MKSIAMGALLCASLFTGGAHAGWLFDKVDNIPLSEQDAAALRGKTVSVTFHETPDFGGGLMQRTFQVRGRGIDDPSVFVRETLGTALRDVYGMQVHAPDTTPTEETKTEKLARLHPESDYVFDVATTNWSITPFDSDYMGLYLQYRARARLIETSSARVVTDVQCWTTTQQHKDRPLRKMYEYDNLKLARDVFASLGWKCMHVLAEHALRLPAGAVPQTPEAIVDPIAVFMKPRPAPAPAAK